MKEFIKSLSVMKKIYASLDNQYIRNDFVISQLKKLPNQSKILDAGCGSQQYRKYSHQENLISRFF